MIFPLGALSPSLRVRFGICAGLCLSAAFTVLFSRQLGIRDWVMPLRIVASSSFIAAALIHGRSNTRYGWGVLGFLIFCWLGDICGPLNFLLGVFFFLVAHVVVSVGIWLHGIKWRRFLLTLGIIVLLNSGIYLAFVTQIQSDERIMILAYTAVIGLMVASAAALDAPSVRRIALAAAILFWISDVELGLTRYAGAGFAFTVTGYPIYYTACLLFALSAVILKIQSPIEANENPAAN